MCMCVCMCVCICGGERECVCVCMCMCGNVCLLHFSVVVTDHLFVSSFTYLFVA